MLRVGLLVQRLSQSQWPLAWEPEDRKGTHALGHPSRIRRLREWEEAEGARRREGTFQQSCQPREYGLREAGVGGRYSS